MDPCLQSSAPGLYFEPRTAQEVWQLANSSHPAVGKAQHLGEARALIARTRDR